MRGSGERGTFGAEECNSQVQELLLFDIGPIRDRRRRY